MPIAEPVTPPEILVSHSAKDAEPKSNRYSMTVMGRVVALDLEDDTPRAREDLAVLSIPVAAMRLPKPDR